MSLSNADSCMAMQVALSWSQRTQLSVCERKSSQIIQNRPCALPAPGITVMRLSLMVTWQDSLCLNPISTSSEASRILIHISLNGSSGFTDKWFQGSLFCVQTVTSREQSSAMWLEVSSVEFSQTPWVLENACLGPLVTMSSKYSWTCQEWGVLN